MSEDILNDIIENNHVEDDSNRSVTCTAFKFILNHITIRIKYIIF